MRFLAAALLLFACCIAVNAQDWPYQQPLSVTCNGDPLGCANVEYADGWGQSAGAFGDFTSAGYPVTFALDTGIPSPFSNDTNVFLDCTNFVA